MTYRRDFINSMRERCWQGVKWWVRWRFPTVDRISTETLATQLADRLPIVIVDARKRDEYAVSHLQDALWATSVGEVEPLVASRDRLVIVYCSIGYRSARLVEQLVAVGYKAVNLEGSLFQWANENRPLVCDGRRTTQVHPYNSMWGLLLEPETKKVLLE